ncbi:MAG TPA: hypothetical protein VH257_13065, partial [Chloroflexota bacterium]|nr:hypothetical protein [Chloroflexota bacterium]
QPHQRQRAGPGRRGGPQRGAEMVYRAVQLDPLTGALLPLGRVREMVDELFAAEAQYLPQIAGARSRPEPVALA